MLISASSTIRIRDQIIAAQLEDGTVALNVASGEYYNLNPMASWIWGKLGEQQQAESLLNALLETYDVDRERGWRDLTRFIQQMDDAGLILVQDAA